MRHFLYTAAALLPLICGTSVWAQELAPQPFLAPPQLQERAKIAPNWRFHWRPQPASRTATSRATAI